MTDLKQQNDELLNRYYHRQGDEIDEALGQFINSYPEREKMKIMFLRESQGVYQFGQRKVSLKVEKGGQIFVRVGGGFLHVREFINEFTQPEIDRLERSDVLTRFQTKQIVQNIAAHKASGGLEGIPICVP